MNYSQQMQEILDQALTEKTFSLEVIGRIKEMKESIASLESENTRLREHNEKLQQTVKDDQTAMFDLKKQILEANDLLVLWQKREDDLKKREVEQTIVDHERLFQSRRGDELKEIVMAMCKNPVFTQTKTATRQEIMPPSNNGYYGTTQNLTDIETTEETIK